MPSVREVVRPWWRIGLVGALANLVLLGIGMGIALGAIPVGLGLGYWIARKARRLGSLEGGQLCRRAVWGVLVAGGLAMHAELAFGTTILMLLGPAEMGRAISGELYGALPWLFGIVRWPALLDSIGAFWILQTFSLAFLGFALTLLSAMLWAKASDISNTERSSPQEVCS